MLIYKFFIIRVLSNTSIPLTDVANEFDYNSTKEQRISIKAIQAPMVKIQDEFVSTLIFISIKIVMLSIMACPTYIY